MVLAKTSGAKIPTTFGLFWDTLPNDTLNVQMMRLSPRQPPKWMWGIDNTARGYNPVHGFSAEAGASDSIETSATHTNAYINDYDMGFGGSYDWHIDIANEQYATGRLFEASTVSDVPLADAPRTAITNILCESGHGEFSQPMMNGIYYRDDNELSYSGEDWELTGRYDASSLPPASTEWSLFEKGRSCSAYLMKMILNENTNKINYRSKQSWSIPL